MSIKRTPQDTYTRDMHDVIRCLPNYLDLLEQLKAEHRAFMDDNNNLYQPRFQALALIMAEHIGLRGDKPNPHDQRWDFFYQSVRDLAERVS